MKPTALLSLPGAVVAPVGALPAAEVSVVLLEQAAPPMARTRASAPSCTRRCRTDVSFSLLRCCVDLSARRRSAGGRHLEDLLEALGLLGGPAPTEHDQDGDDHDVGDGVQGELVDAVAPG